jgi:hypothetical protein
MTSPDQAGARRFTDRSGCPTGYPGEADKTVGPTGDRGRRYFEWPAHAESLAQGALAEGYRINDSYSQRLAVVALIEIAATRAELGVSPNTITTHLRAVFRKLDVKSRVQLTIAFRARSAGTGPADHN